MKNFGDLVEVAIEFEQLLQDRNWVYKLESRTDYMWGYFENKLTFGPDLSSGITTHMVTQILRTDTIVDDQLFNIFNIGVNQIRAIV